MEKEAWEISIRYRRWQLDTMRVDLNHDNKVLFGSYTLPFSRSQIQKWIAMFRLSDFCTVVCLKKPNFAVNLEFVRERKAVCSYQRVPYSINPLREALHKITCESQ